MFFEGKYKRRTPPINMSVRDEGLSVIALQLSFVTRDSLREVVFKLNYYSSISCLSAQKTKVRGGGVGNRLDHC